MVLLLSLGSGPNCQLIPLTLLLLRLSDLMDFHHWLSNLLAVDLGTPQPPWSLEPIPYNKQQIINQHLSIIYLSILPLVLFLWKMLINTESETRKEKKNGDWGSLRGSSISPWFLVG